MSSSSSVSNMSIGSLADALTTLTVSDNVVHSFFHDNFQDTQANRLALWQSLCIEFGLVQQDDSDDSYSRTPSDDTDPTSGTSVIDLPTMPKSLTQTSKLLSTKAHVNIVDYRKARMSIGDRPATWGEFAHLVFPNAAELRKYTLREAKKRRNARKRAALELAAHGNAVSNNGNRVYRLDKAKQECLQPLLRFIFPFQSRSR